MRNGTVMADMVDIPTGWLTAGTLALGTFTGAVAYLWKGKQKEVDDARAETKAVQGKYEELLKAMAAAEPQRAQALDKIAATLAENTALLRERVRP